MYKAEDFQMSGNNIEVPVVYEDNHLLAVNKPAGMLVQPAYGDEFALEVCMKTYLKRKYDKPGEVFLGICHRIDRPVSGLVLMARTSKALVRLNQQFKDKEPKKTYHALVEGRPLNQEDQLTGWLLRDMQKNKSRIVQMQQQGAKEAKLRYKVLAQGNNLSLLEVHLETGRHHQIRAQLAHAGWPIYGDVKYGARRGLKDRSIALHAQKLRLLHPVRKEKITLLADYPRVPWWEIFKTDQ